MNLLLFENGVSQLIPNWVIFAQTSTEVAIGTTPSSDTITGISSMWIPILFGALSYVLIQHGIIKSRTWVGAGLLSLLIAAGASFGFTDFSLESCILMVFFTIAAGGGIGFLTAREPVYAALGFTSAVLSVCGVLFMQSALFVAAATMIVYAGATIIIFLFVLMFAQQTELRNYDVQLNKPLFSAVIGAILLATITLCVTSANAMLPIKTDSTRALSAANLPDELSTEAGREVARKLDAIDPTLRFIPKSTAGLGRSLYTDYLLAVELAGTVLLVATIGAIALAQRSTETSS